MPTNEYFPNEINQPNRRGRMGQAMVKLLRRLDWLDDDEELLHESKKDFLKSFAAISAVNLSSFILAAGNRVFSGERPLNAAQLPMETFDLAFPAMFVWARNFDERNEKLKAHTVRAVAYLGHAAVAAYGGYQTYRLFSEGVGESGESLLLSGATGIANGALLVHDIRQRRKSQERNDRNNLGLRMTVLSNIGESFGGVIGAGIGKFHESGSAYAGMAMSAIVGATMAGAAVSELHALQKKAVDNKTQVC